MAMSKADAEMVAKAMAFEYLAADSSAGKQSVQNAIHRLHCYMPYNSQASNTLVRVFNEIILRGN